MSQFFHPRYRELTAYTPGEQPRDRAYIKLNTNESPFAPPEKVVAAVTEATRSAHLYCDPTCHALRMAAADCWGVGYDNVLAFNGSDEVLSFAFAAFGADGVAYPAISYGFYPVFAKINQVAGHPLPLKQDLRIRPEDYHGLNKAIVIANPNAPTGLYLLPEEVEGILQTNPHHVVVVDEAYIDFGGESVLPLIKRYDNLLVTRTFSKSHALAGARVGFGIGSAALIEDLNTLRYSTNPYNVSTMGQAAGLAALQENAYYMDCCITVCENRAYTMEQLRKQGFFLTHSKANFVFARHPDISGQRLYQALREKGVLVRWFNQPDIVDFIRITVGSRPQMDALLTALQDIISEENYAPSTD